MSSIVLAMRNAPKASAIRFAGRSFVLGLFAIIKT
jgi:hypothetical protein